MARQFLKVSGGVCVNAVLFPDEGIPEGFPEAETYIESPHPIGSTVVDGVVVPPEPDPPRSEAEIAAQLDAMIEAIAANKDGLRALAEGLFEVAKAARTGNWTVFVDRANGQPVSNRAGFFRWLRARLDT